MKAKVRGAKSRYAFGRTCGLFSRLVWLGAAILIYSSASAQNMFVSGGDARGGEIFKFSWDGKQSLFATDFYKPRDVAVDGASNLFVVDYMIVAGDVRGYAAIFKITPNGALSIFASGISYASSLAVDKASNLFVADYEDGVIYQFKPTGERATFASGLYHPVGVAFDSAGNLFVADNSIGNLYQGSIYKYSSNGTRVTLAVLELGDRPTDLAFDSTGNLYMADAGGRIYRYGVSGALRPRGRTIFGAVPNSAQSLAFDSAGNLLVVDGGAMGNNENVISTAVYKFTQQGARSLFASGQDLGESFVCLAFQPISCCQ